MYYLQSRYYDPNTGRFINADALVSTGQGLLGNNMFAYCRNNPISRKDVSGTEDISVTTDDNGNPFDDMEGPRGGHAASAGGGGDGASGGTYYYGVDFSQATYSSTVSGGIYNTGYSFYSGYSSPFTGSACFIAGTLVQSENRAVPIEEISVGDKVWSWNEETGEISLKEVVETYVNETTELIHVFVNGKEIITTPEHPFYSPVKGWTKAARLRAGDILVLLNGEYVVVERIQHEILEAPITVYNFQVKDYHTYYIDDLAILVHNSCQKGVGGKGWVGDSTWRNNVKIVKNGGTIKSLNGLIPTQSEGIQLIEAAGGSNIRIEAGHDYPNPHTYPHINYLVGKTKGTLQIVAVEG